MAEASQNVIQRKVGTARAGAEARQIEGRPGPDKSWRLALARAARDRLKLALDVTRSSLDRMGLAEVLETAPQGGLIAVLEGPKAALGVLMLGADVLAGMIEAQTTGIVSSGPVEGRRPTRTDAAMVAGTIDSALAELERGLGDLAEGGWALGYRYASFLEDLRPLGLLLEDAPFKVLRCEVSLALGAKSGTVFLALPDAPPRAGADTDPAQGDGEAARFAEDLSAHVLAATGQLDGVLARISLTLAGVMDLEAGQILGLGTASVGNITLEGMDGRRLWEGKLGQSRGQRAVRLTEVAAASAPRMAQVQPAAPLAAAPAPPLLATGTG